MAKYAKVIFIVVISIQIISAIVAVIMQTNGVTDYEVYYIEDEENLIYSESYNYDEHIIKRIAESIVRIIPAISVVLLIANHIVMKKYGMNNSPSKVASMYLVLCIITIIISTIMSLILAF